MKVDCVKVGDIETNCWLYCPEEEGESRFCFVIDPGDEAALIISRLRELNWVPRYILLTHGHFDHVMAIPDILEAFEKGIFGANPEPKVGIHRMDAHYLGKDAQSVHRKSFTAVGGNSSYIDALWKPLKTADILFEEGDTLAPFKVLHVPGHTQGSAAFYDENSRLIFTGDTLFKGDWGRTDLPGGNEALIQQSLKRLLSTIKEDTIVCPGHGAVTTIREEQRT
jgi:glyoxylase-like metal-dependent hydrolase (beta-lactamase superfamily II)